MNDQLIEQLLYYANRIWQRRWIAAGVTLVTCLVGWLLVATLPNTYVSSAKIYLDTKSVLGPLLSGLAVDSNVAEELQVMQQTLLTRPNLETLARDTDRDVEAKTFAQHEALLEEMRDAVTLGYNRSNIFTIEFTDENPRRAKASVDRLIGLVMEQHLGASREDMAGAHRFLQEQIVHYKSQLETAEKKLAEFKQNNLGMLPGQGGYYERLQKAKAALLQATTALQDTVTERDVLTEQLAALPEMVDYGGASSMGPPTDTMVQMNELQAQLDKLLLNYTEQHPDVLAIKERMKRVREERAIEERLLQTNAEVFQANRGQGSRSGFVMPNPLYTELRLTLAEKEARIAQLRDQVTRTQAEMEHLESRAMAVPTIEAQLSRLSRDYDVLKSRYDELLSRREAANISRSREATIDRVQFRIVEPPVVPHLPAGPNRPLLLTAVLVLGLGAGVAVALGLALVDKTFSSVRHLRNSLDLPVVGTVSYVLTGRRKAARRLELSLLMVMVAFIVLSYGTLMFIETQIGFSQLIAALQSGDHFTPAIDLIKSKLPFIG